MAPDAQSEFSSVRVHEKRSAVAAIHAVTVDKCHGADLTLPCLAQTRFDQFEHLAIPRLETVDIN